MCVVSFGAGLGTVNVRLISVELPTKFRNPCAVMRYVVPGISGLVGESVTTMARSGGGALGFAGGGGLRGLPGVGTGRAAAGGGVAGGRACVVSARRAESAICAWRA